MSESYSSRDAKRCLIPLLVIFILGILCLQAFNLVFQKIGADLGAADQASLITAIPGIVLGIVCFIYGSLSDFVALKRMTAAGIVALFVGSVLGFLFHSSLGLVILARAIQTAGAQVAGSVFLVVAARYLEPAEKVVYFGVFTAGYQLSTAIGVLAGGFLSTVDWAYLFLIPAVGILFLPMILKSLPDNETTSGHIDIAGFCIFGLAVALLTLYFTFGSLALLAGSVALFVVFAVYINRASEPFVTPDFFRNGGWLAGVLLIFTFYFPNYAISPIVNSLGSNLYGLDSAQVSMYLVWGNLAGAACGIMSGKVMGRIGRRATLFLAGTLYAAGLLVASFLVSSGMAALVPALMLVYAGMGLLYSPLVDTVLSQLPASQSGRGIGMNDLFMNVSPSIGISIFGGLIGTSALTSGSPVGVTGAAANYSNLLLILAVIIVASVALYAAFSRVLAKGEEAARAKNAAEAE